MGIYKRNKFLTLILAILFSFSVCASIPIGNLTNATEPQLAYPDTIDITYYGADCGEYSNKCITKDGVESPYNGEPIYISEDKTIELNGVTIVGQVPDTSPDAPDSDKCKASPITIAAGAKVNIIISGENTLTAKSDKNSAGIYVQHYEIFDKDHSENDVINDATLNIFGKDNKDTGNKLNVTGGYYGAGIGGVGTGHRSPGTPGIINIYSGTILAQGGTDSAGIGSGRSSSGNEINIYSGDITALAGGNGAGIGTGYGTSGGGTEGKVGSYNAGIINITGGTIRAAAGKFKEGYSFEDFDIYNTEYFFENCYESNGFGAGIGGGYGATSGQITIGGDAYVTAIGSCGGAGIGSGRGTSKLANYDTNCTPVDITIKDNATVVAAAPDDTRNNQGGGAGVGSGRGFNDGGIIQILNNANVIAVGSPYTAAIGGSWKVGSIDLTDPTLIAKPDTLTVDPTTTLSAVSDSFVDAISLPDGQVITSLISLSFTDDFFTNNSDILNNESIVKFPLKIEAQDTEHPENKTVFAINKNQSSCLVNLPGQKYRFKILGEDESKNIYLSNSIEENSATFFNLKDSYEITGLTSPIEQEATIKNGDEDLKIKIKGDAGIFEYGSTFHAESVTDPDQIAQLTAELDDVYENKLERVHFYDMGVTHRKAENEGESPAEYETFKGGPVTISVQVPNGWDKDELLALYVKADEGDDQTFNHRIETIDGLDYIVFETTHFSKYATFDPDTHVDPGNSVFPTTGDNIDILILAILSLFFKSFSSMFMLYCQK